MIKRSSPKNRINPAWLCVGLVVWLSVTTSAVWADRFVEPSVRQAVIEQSKFIQIPGPNPVLKPGSKGAWDDGVVEAADAFKDIDTYYFYYHATGKNQGYRLGVASADHPLGPWKKYKNNPILEDFGYLGGVIKVDGKYRIYSAHPIHMPWAKWDEGKSRSKTYHTDYSPLAVATGDKSQGPFTKYEGNPLMTQGEVGEWDEGGISEAEVLYHNGMFHMYYGATERVGPRAESVGYAYSFDGLKFYKYGNNPVAVRQVNPNAAAFAEVHAIMEPPFIYLYHTLRYERDGEDRFPWHEHLGVQILTTQTPFSLDMPVLNIETLPAGKTTTLDVCPPIYLGCATKAALTAECTFGKEGAAPIRIYVYPSYDGVHYDTLDGQPRQLYGKVGQIARKTFTLDTNVRYIKVRVSNSGGKTTVSNVKVTASLGN